MDERTRVSKGEECVLDDNRGVGRAILLRLYKRGGTEFVRISLRCLNNCILLATDSFEPRAEKKQKKEKLRGAQKIFF